MEFLIVMALVGMVLIETPFAVASLLWICSVIKGAISGFFAKIRGNDKAGGNS